MGNAAPAAAFGWPLLLAAPPALWLIALWLLLGAVAALATGAWAWRAWLFELLLALDQLANVLVTPWHAGAKADETLSARAWRARLAGRLWGRLTVPLIDTLFRWQHAPGGHCRQAYERERLCPRGAAGQPNPGD